MDGCGEESGVLGKTSLILVSIPFAPVGMETSYTRDCWIIRLTLAIRPISL